MKINIKHEVSKYFTQVIMFKKITITIYSESKKYSYKEICYKKSLICRK